MAAMSESERKRGPAEFGDRFTIFPDSGVTELHCLPVRHGVARRLSPQP
jgi:hypothetical protein